MIALDTNVLVRFLTQDDDAQFQVAADLIEGCTRDLPGYVCREVMIELVWVLERAYKYSREEIADALLSIVTASQLLVENAQDIASIVNLYRDEGYDFADLMIRQAAQRTESRILKTFDQKLARLDGVELLGTTH
jgi:predicted nucleic-acid-binding protein